MLIVLMGNIVFLTLYKGQTVADPNLKSFTAEELKVYDGTNPNLPIYLAYNRNIYDVTSGKSYYETGGTYHYLAGKDSTTELNFAGGGIIKAKYKIIGRLVK